MRVSIIFRRRNCSYGIKAAGMDYIMTSATEHHTIVDRPQKAVVFVHIVAALVRDDMMSVVLEIVQNFSANGTFPALTKKCLVEHCFTKIEMAAGHISLA